MTQIPASNGHRRGTRDRPETTIPEVEYIMYEDKTKSTRGCS